MSKLEKYERNKQENRKWKRAIANKSTKAHCGKCGNGYKFDSWMANNMRCPNCGNKYE